MNTQNKLDIAPGLYFDKGSVKAEGFIGRILLCVKITGSRVYFHRYNSKPHLMAEILESTPEFCSLNSVNFIRKTVEEMVALQALDEELTKEFYEMRNAIIKKYNLLIAEISCV